MYYFCAPETIIYVPHNPDFNIMTNIKTSQVCYRNLPWCSDYAILIYDDRCRLATIRLRI
jgi:hypothetical protein